MFKKVKADEDKRQQIESILKESSQIPESELLEKFETSYKGYTEEQVEDMQDEYGRNIIDIKNNRSIFISIYESIVNPFNLVLIIVAIVTFITDVTLAGSPSYETFILIMATILISGIIAFSQQEKSNKAARKLQKMISNKVDVKRDGKIISIDIEEVVPGDIVKLSSGDMIPGDVRFLQTKDLFIDQASLTGESNPVEKFSTVKEAGDVTSVSNIGFMGTNVVSGTSTAIVLETANNTYFGSMAKSISTYKEKSSFEKGVDSVSKLLIRFMLVMVPIIFVTNLLTKDDWIGSLLFGITIAVGLTPEMLPVIMTSTLATGATEMSKKKTIVKRLGAIQTFGEMDILCTDKTGTLTEDRIILEKYMNVLGDEDNRILRHGFLNSYFQTGLKNLIDVAIISRAEKEGLKELRAKYVREDEIPFDFARRRMSVVLKDNTEKRQLITKGAVDEIMSICSFVEMNGEVKELEENLKKQEMNTYEKQNND
jgi:Mg2+-importing ATPase